MEIENLMRVLSAIIPEKVKEWQYIRDLANPEMRVACEKEIISTAYQLLGDFRNQLYLSLPPKEKRDREIRLGNLKFGQKKVGSFGISKGELLRGMSIFGTHGSGKTNVVLSLVKQLVEKDIPFLFLDWKRNVRDLIPQVNKRIDTYTVGKSLSPLNFNPFYPPPNFEKHQYIDMVIDVMSKAFQLGEGARKILQSVLSNSYQSGNLAPTPMDLIEEISKLKLNSKSKNWSLTAERALEGLEFSKIVPGGSQIDEELFQKLSSNFSVVELDGLSAPIKKFLVPLICLWLYLAKLATEDREKLQLVIIVEEAHNILPVRSKGTSESFLEGMIKQSRELGIAFILVDQHPSELSSVAGNMYSTACLHLTQPEDTRRASELLLLKSDQRKWLNRLSVGEGILKLHGRWQDPVHLEFPHMKLSKGSLCDKKLKAYLENSITHSGLRSFLRKEFGTSEHIPGNDRVNLSSDELNFLHDISTHPTDPVSTRYKRLKFGMNKGNRIKNKLVEQEYLKANKIQVGNTQRLILSLTQEAKQLVSPNLDNNEPRTYNESQEHIFWKNFYKKLYASKGYKVKEEAPRPNSDGKVDLLARKGAESVAIEIETGKSNFFSNLINNLQCEFSKLLVVATNKKSINRIQNLLKSKNMIFSQKIEVRYKNKNKTFNSSFNV